MESIIRNNEKISNVETIPVVVIIPPFFPHGIPSLAAGILKTSLKERGIIGRVLYANILFVETIGIQFYEELLENAFNNLAFERLFATIAHDSLEKINLKLLNGDEVPGHLRHFYQVVMGVYKDISHDKYSEMEDRCKIFIEKAAEKIVNLRPKIIGFSSTLQQTNSSIALARAIKQTLPDAICVIGGNNCDGVMGEELSSSIEIFDYVFQGEADFAFADFCHNYLKNNNLPKEKLIRCPTTHNLNAVPIPDYSDFFEQSIIPLETVILSFESSRGCWWGQKKQCKFCGESYIDTGYRAKSPERMFKELHQIHEKYPDVHSFFATDSIFPYAYLKNFLPKLAFSGFWKRIVYQARADLTYEQIIKMKEVGINYIFPGIESLSTRLLNIMNKGTNALMNIRFLRNCRELDVLVNWLLLVGIPGDRVSDYEEQLQLIPSIQHLSPPQMNPIRIHRFSPYSKDAETHSITEIKPINAYKYAFPESVDVARIAYYFDAKYPSESREHPEILTLLKHQLDRWLERWGRNDVPKLSVQRIHGNQWIVEDSRECAKASTQVLDKDEYLLLKQCRLGISPEHIKSNGLIKRLLEPGYLVEVDGKLLSIVCDLGMIKEAKSKINQSFVFK